MDKKIVNKEQFTKLVINEAKKYLSEETDDKKEVKIKSDRKISFSEVESLINEMEKMPTSISSIIKNDRENIEEVNNIENESWTPNEKRDFDVLEHNKKKNIIHVNENEKDKWKRMLDYNIPKDEER